MGSVVQDLAFLRPFLCLLPNLAAAPEASEPDGTSADA
jgi:hypothetical protein